MQNQSFFLFPNCIFLEKIWNYSIKVLYLQRKTNRFSFPFVSSANNDEGK